MFYHSNPWGEHRADLRNGLNCVITLQGHGHKPRLDLNRYVMFGKQKPKRMTVEDVEKDMEAWRKRKAELRARTNGS